MRTKKSNTRQNKGIYVGKTKNFFPKKVYLKENILRFGPARSGNTASNTALQLYIKDNAQVFFWEHSKRPSMTDIDAFGPIEPRHVMHFHDGYGIDKNYLKEQADVFMVCLTAHFSKNQNISVPGVILIEEAEILFSVLTEKQIKLLINYMGICRAYKTYFLITSHRPSVLKESLQKESFDALCSQIQHFILDASCFDFPDSLYMDFFSRLKKFTKPKAKSYRYQYLIDAKTKESRVIKKDFYMKYKKKTVATIYD